MNTAQPQVKNSGTGTISADPWLVLTITPITQTIDTSHPAIINADLTLNSKGENTYNLYGKHIPNGIVVTFSTNFGQL